MYFFQAYQACCRAQTYCFKLCHSIYYINYGREELNSMKDGSVAVLRIVIKSGHI